MTDFLIKSTISMALLLAVYHFLLQREKMHRFNRFYLLSAVVFSLVLPFITIEIYTEVAAAPITVLPDMAFAPAPAPQAETVNYLPYIAWAIYGLVVLALALRFALNILQFTRKIKSNEAVGHEGAILVLLDEPVLPHTFLNYIFINKGDYKSRMIEKELFTHELAHVNQRHTLDILSIEALRTVFWFNPLLYFYKKAIQLNHEFLADEIVVTEGDNVIGYQQLLLQKATPATYYQLASSLNFSITKKRFTMMTKATTRSRALLLKLSALPVIAGLIVFLCIETTAQERVSDGVLTNKGKSQDTLSNDAKRDRYYAGVRVVIDDRANGVQIDKPYEELTQEQKRKYLHYTGTAWAKKTPTAKEFESWKDKSKFALWLDGKNIDNAVLGKYKSQDIAAFTGSSVLKNARTKQHPQPYQFQLYTKGYFDKNLKDRHLKYDGAVYRMTVYKDKGATANSAPGVVNALAPSKNTRIEKVEVDEVAEVVEVEEVKEEKIYPITTLDPQPEFPGGLGAFYQAVNKEFKIPAVNEDMTARIYVSFVVEKDGSMSNMKVMRDPGHGLGDEALRTLKAITTKWTPGKSNGEPVRAVYHLPITINIKK